MAEKENGKLIKDLLEKDEEFKKVYSAHEEYKKQLAEIDKKSYLTTDAQITRKKIQKLKLAEKDKMEIILSRYRVGN